MTDEPLEKQNWKLTDAQDTICDYASQSATAKYHGLTWNVYYTEDVPASIGPWKLGGLPGLITKATDAKGIHTFTLYGFHQEETPIIITQYVNWIVPDGRGKFAAQRVDYQKMKAWCPATRRKTTRPQNGPARHQQVNRRQRGPFEVRRENDSVLYIGISTFSLSQLDTDSVVDAIHAAERDSVPFLIFDVRNNFGGDAGVQARITRALLGRTPDRPHTGYQRVNAHLFKSGTLNWPEGDTIFGSNFKPVEGRKGLYLMEEEEDNATLSAIDSLGFGGRLYVLIDSRSASASAFLAGAVKRNDRGYIVGRETMSAYHCETCIKFANIYLPNSEFQASIPMVRVVIDETVSERLPARRGVIPDCDIPMTEAEFHYDGDYILDRTLQLIADGTYLLNGQWKKEYYQLSIINCAEGAIVFALAAIALVAAFLFLRRAKDRKTSQY